MARASSARERHICVVLLVHDEHVGTGHAAALTKRHPFRAAGSADLKVDRSRSGGSSIRRDVHRQRMVVVAICRDLSSSGGRYNDRSVPGRGMNSRRQLTKGDQGAGELGDGHYVSYLIAR